MIFIEAQQSILEKFYIYKDLQVQILAKNDYGVKVLDETGRKYMIPSCTKLLSRELKQIAKAEDSVENKKEIALMEKIQDDVVKTCVIPTPSISARIKIEIDHLLCTAPSTGIAVLEVMSEVRKKISSPELSSMPDLKLRDFVYTQLDTIRLRGEKDICAEKRRFSFRSPNAPLPLSKQIISATPHPQPTPSLKMVETVDITKLASASTVEAQDAEIGKIYYSPKGIPCKIIEKTLEGVKVLSKITHSTITLSVDFPLIPERELIPLKQYNPKVSIPPKRLREE